MCRFCDLDAPLLHRAEVGDEAERRDQRLAGPGDGLAVDVDLDRLEGPVAVQLGDLRPW